LEAGGPLDRGRTSRIKMRLRRAPKGLKICPFGPLDNASALSYYKHLLFDKSKRCVANLSVRDQSFTV
jgi:hypothetical protein